MFLHEGISFVLTAGIEPAYICFRDSSLTNSVREHNGKSSLFDSSQVSNLSNKASILKNFYNFSKHVGLVDPTVHTAVVVANQILRIIFYCMYQMEIIMTIDF